MKKYLIATIAAGALFVLGGFMIFQYQRITQLESSLDALHQSVLHQAAEEVDALSLSMEKVLLSADPARTAALLSEISQTAGDVQQCLAFLPVENPVMLPALRLASQLSSDATSLLPLVVEQGGFSPDQLSQLTRQRNLCAQLSSQLSLAESTGDLAAITLEPPLPEEAPPVQAKGLPSGDITQEEALDIARSFVGDDRVVSIQAAPGTSGALAAYGVTVQTADVQLNLEITRQGGKVLWMMPETASFPVTQSVETCRTAALAFLELHGFGSMLPVHHQIYDGLCVISCVPLQEDVLLYPDLVKIQLRMDTAQVVGLEAHNYWLNHTRRTLPEPGLTEAAARAHLTDQVNVENVQLCLIPQQGDEVLCYEFAVAHGDDRYLIYIDAASGHEVQLLKTVPLENGSLTA